MIWNWNEKRLIAIVLPIFTFLSAIYIIIGLLSPDWDLNQYMPNYNSLNVPMYREGRFCDERMPRQMAAGTLTT